MKGWIELTLVIILVFVGAYVFLGVSYDWDGERLLEDMSEGKECETMKPCSFYCIQDDGLNYVWNDGYITTYKPVYRGDGVANCRCRVLENQPTIYAGRKKPIEFTIDFNVNLSDCMGLENE